MKNTLLVYLLFIFITCLALCSACQSGPKPVAQLAGKNIRIGFNHFLYGQVTARFDGKEIPLADYAPSEFITIAGNDLTDFVFTGQQETSLTDKIGNAKQLTVTGETDNIRKEVSVTVYEEFPAMAVFRVVYTNTGPIDLQIERWVNNYYRIEALPAAEEETLFWSYQSGSYDSRPDWVLPLHIGFEQENYMGMNASDYGGGTPVVDVWRRDAGLGVGHLEMTPKLVSLPVRMGAAHEFIFATAAVEYQANRVLKPGESLATFRTFVSVHRGDYFTTLAEYRRFMEKQGVQPAEYPETAYEPAWCAWGYERNFTMEQIYNTLPKVKELGYQWAVLDDGWQTAEGDWYLVKSKYPRGDQDMQAFTRTIHQAGIKPGLWWAPLAVDPGTDLIKEHPEYLLLNKDGSKQNISWWDAYYLCPAYPPVQEYTKKLVEKIMKTWDYDGLKIDGQHLNGAPPCYNPAHNHAYPEESVEKVPEFFKAIYETALSIKPRAVVQICPCGTAYAFHTMPFMNQPVASDPTSSWQIRLKGKTLKALMGPSVPYYGDHVELSDNKDDFASTVGIGGVVGTKFTWPVGAKKDSEVDLTPEKEPLWRKWTAIYLDKMLSKGIYRGELYDLGFDRPETHAIEKEGKMYYAFYADSYQGTVELRGLEKKSYKVYDYVNEKDYGAVTGPTAKLPVEFTRYLLLEAAPQ